MIISLAAEFWQGQVRRLAAGSASVGPARDIGPRCPTAAS